MPALSTTARGTAAPTPVRRAIGDTVIVDDPRYQALLDAVAAGTETVVSL